jgi:hypothetical protein
VKKINKKLVLNKETIADLKADEMKAVQGGVSMGHPSCFETGCCPLTEWTCPTGPPMDCHLP